jgi:hypothetical protein
MKSTRPTHSTYFQKQRTNLSVAMRTASMRLAPKASKHCPSSWQVDAAASRPDDEEERAIPHDMAILPSNVVMNSSSAVAGIIGSTTGKSCETNLSSSLLIPLHMGRAVFDVDLNFLFFYFRPIVGRPIGISEFLFVPIRNSEVIGRDTYTSSSYIIVFALALQVN